MIFDILGWLLLGYIGVIVLGAILKLNETPEVPITKYVAPVEQPEGGHFPCHLQK